MLIASRKIFRLSTGIGVVVVLALAGLGLLAVSLARESQWWVTHTQTVLGESKDLLASMMGAESGTRGFLITGDDEFLAPFKAASVSVPQHMGRLKELTVDNPDQQIRLGQLEEIIERKMEIMKAAQDSRRQGLPPKMDTEVMNKFRVHENDFENEEQKLFTARTATLKERYRLIYLSLCVLGIAAASGMVYFERKLEKVGVRMRTAEDVARQAQKMESIGQLTGGVAHDFNNILQAVMTNLELAMRKLPPRQAESDFIQAAMVGLEKGARLTSQLLAFARRQPLQPEPIAVGRLLDESVAFLRRTLGEKYQIESIGSGGLWRAMIDSHLLHNALLNLALNARDAMPEGGKLTIEAANVMLDANYAEREREVTPGQYVMIAVSDTGTGMSKELIDRVFEPFFTTKAEGTGLGLPMVYGFIKQSQGHIKIYSEQGHGTTVKMYLPRTTKEEEVRVELKEKELRGDGRTVLVVEDDDSVRAGVVTQLSDLGYKVVAASDGLSALDIIRKDRSVDILFTDVVLSGGMNGRKLADSAREIRPELPVVYTSGYTENAIIHHGRLDEGAILLSKPYRTADLARVLGGALKGSTNHVSGPAANASSDAAGPRTILIVEDNEIVRSSFIMALEDMDFRVMAAETATEALAILKNGNKVDLLISDVGLPDMNGIKLAEAARKHNPALDIVIASGNHHPHEEIDKLLGRPIRWLLKPFTTEQLLDVVG